MTERKVVDRTGHLPDGHIIARLGMELLVDDDSTLCRVELTPAMWSAQTRRPRLGLLSIIHDVVSGNLPPGAITPTVDLRIQAIGEIPASGPVEFVSRAVKWGRQLVSVHTVASVPGVERPFLRGVTTFINNHDIDSPLLDDATGVGVPTESYDALLATTIVDPETLALEPIASVVNGEGKTVQGGVQALLAELAVEHVLGPDRSAYVHDIDIRYLNAMKVGPLHAHASVIGSLGDGDEPRHQVFSVVITDAGYDKRVVSTVSLLAMVGRLDH